MTPLYRTCAWIVLSAAGLAAQDYFFQQADKAREQAERVREQSERVREQSDRARERADRASEEADRALNQYWEASRAVQEQKYEKALKVYEKLLEKNSAQTEGSLYWKAYTLNKLGRGAEAATALAQLQKAFPNGRWLNDAKALQLEISQSAGQKVSPESQSDEDLKLLAINSLMGTDPERAVPLLEKLLADPKNSPRLKERALFVLAQSRSPRAMEVLARFAKGATNPDLQMKAVEYLGIHGSKEGRQILSDVYSSTSDPAVKRSVLRAFMLGRDREHLLSAAKSESNADLRRQAIHLLGISGGQAELAQLYTTESSADLKEAILHAMFLSGNSDKLIELAKTEKDPNLRRDAIHNLGLMRGSKTSDALVALYGTETDKGLKREVLTSLFLQGGAKQIVEIARKETDPEMKREAVHRLSMMRSKEATDYMMELLNK